jgi:GPH family glycoside/pentoside/hexuronide:cation symporter
LLFFQSAFAGPMMTSEPQAAAEAAALRKTPVGLGLIGLYGAGNLADSVTMTALNTFLFFYLTAVCGLPNTLAGLAGLLALCVDAVADPVVGALSDNSHSRIGRRHPFMFAGTLPLAIGLGLIFSIPTGLHGYGLFAFVLVVSIILRVSHSTYFLPYVGLGAELSDDYAERTNIVSARFLFQVIGGSLCVILGQYIFLRGPGGNLHRAGYTPFAWACAAIIAVASFGAALGTLPALKRMHQIPAQTAPLLKRIGQDLIELARNPSFRVIFASLLLMFIGAGVIISLTLHAYNFFWKLPSWVIGLMLLAPQAGTLAGVAISVSLARGFDKRVVVLSGLAGVSVIQALFPTLRLLGLLPLAGAALFVVLVGSTFVAYTMTGCVAIAFQSAMIDAADEHEHLFGTRRESLYYAGLNLSAKAAGGVGGFVAGVALDLIHFPTNIAAHPGMHIADATVRELGWIYGPGGGAIYALSILVFFFYGLSPAKHAQIQTELNARRAAVTSEPT